MVVAEDQTLASLLAPDEAAPFELIESDGQRPLLLVCDHASNLVPASLTSLGLPSASLEQHIAWDIGAGSVTRLLSERLRAHAILGGYSRLVMDLNRDLDDPTAFPRISDGVLVPGNLGLTVEARAERARTLFKPYHEAIRRVLQQQTTDALAPVMISIHSFTPRHYGILRPWQVGVLWDKDTRLAPELMATLRESGDLVVGDNQPYSGRHPADYTVDHHAEALGLAYAAIEIRQDLISDGTGQQQWAGRLAKVLEVVLQDQRLFRRLGY